MTATARLTDPDTSHAAAASVTNYLSVQHAILDILIRWGPLTDEQIAAHFKALGTRFSPSGLRTRRKEMVDAGLVVANPRKATLSSGRQGTRWQAADW